MAYLKAMRPVMGIFGSLLCLTALRIQVPIFVHKHWQIVLLLMTSIFLAFSATMLRNDFVDRKHDLKKGKTHAFKHPQLYAKISLRMFVASGFIGAVAIGHNYLWLTIILIVICWLGTYYERTYQKLGLPTITVGLASGSPVLFALVLPGGKNYLLIALLFLAVVTVICAREILKDIEDAEIDKGYKKTVPSCYGASASQWLAAYALILTGALMLPCCLLDKNVGILSSLLLISGLVIAKSKFPEKTGKMVIDVSTVTLLSTFLVFPQGF